MIGENFVPGKKMFGCICISIIAAVLLIILLIIVFAFWFLGNGATALSEADFNSTKSSFEALGDSFKGFDFETLKKPKIATLESIITKFQVEDDENKKKLLITAIDRYHKVVNNMATSASAEDQAKLLELYEKSIKLKFQAASKIAKFADELEAFMTAVSGKTKEQLESHLNGIKTTRNEFIKEIVPLYKDLSTFAGSLKDTGMKAKADFIKLVYDALVSAAK